MDKEDIIEGLKGLVSVIGVGGVVEVAPLAPSGSERQYYRLFTDGSSFIGTYVPDPVEGECFVSLARAFKNAGRHVPEILAVSQCRRLYIQEDLGDVSLFSVLKEDGAEDRVRITLKRLVSLQKTHYDVWVDKCMSSPFCRRQAMWDLNYFKYEFLKPREVIFDEDGLEDDFERLSGRLSSIPDDFVGFMMRDCQSRNVMISDRGPVFIDFQGGRKGPVLYDAVSMLWQARAEFDDGFRKRMLDFYCNEFCGEDEGKKRRMLSALDDIVLFRTLQVLGAYGFRGLVQRKAHFLLSIPGALANLDELVKRGCLDDYPELKRCASEIARDKDKAPEESEKKLIVEILSFSFKKGYPADMSGNGGGFVFDCRALHNPGRYAMYRSLTGRDRPVVDFLEHRLEVHSFLKSAWGLTDSAIERYVLRGFTHIQIGFGCTGGRHRSVYCAERTAMHIRERFPEVDVRLVHREHPE